MFSDSELPIFYLDQCLTIGLSGISSTIVQGSAFVFDYKPADIRRYDSVIILNP